MNYKFIWVISCFVVGLIACNKAITETENFVGFQQPTHFPAPTYNFAANTVSKDGFALGRKLFYEPILSADNSISCGSCHIQSSAFTQHGHSVSHGIFDQLGTRNSLPIMNLAWNTNFLWDGGVFNLDLQPIIPITAPEEMGESMANVLQKLRNNGAYAPMFQKVFGSTDINATVVLKALSQFMLMCVSDQSKYDSVKRNQASFTEAESKGYTVFQQKCNGCHTEPLFTNFSFKNNGLAPSIIDDKGRNNITHQDNDLYKFRVPSLRNLFYTAPYMHDGRFFTLNAVLAHYDHQVQPSTTLDVIFTQNNPVGIPLSNTEQQQLLAFLNTLNDANFISNRNLSEQ